MLYQLLSFFSLPVQISRKSFCSTVGVGGGRVSKLLKFYFTTWITIKFLFLIFFVCCARRCLLSYRTSSVIRQIFSFHNSPKNLDLSNKMDLDLWDCLGRVELVL